jgi:NAD(P)-dependent dehydrogenase (short-subunit alcohol dehydrogenase family)
MLQLAGSSKVLLSKKVLSINWRKTGIRGAECRLELAAEEILNAFGCKVERHPGDVSDLATHSRIVEKAMKTFGRIDVLVSNAGSNIRKQFLEMTVEDYDQLMQIQLKAVFFLSQRVAKTMVEAGG